MNILLLAPQPFFQARGTPIAVKQMAEFLGKQGHFVHLLVFHEGEDIDIPNTTIHRSIGLPGIMGIKPGLSLKKIICDFFIVIKCFQLIKKYSFSLIHAVEESSFIALVLKWLYKKPYVYDMDSCLSLQTVTTPMLFLTAIFSKNCIKFWSARAMGYFSII